MQINTILPAGRLAAEIKGYDQSEYPMITWEALLKDNDNIAALYL